MGKGALVKVIWDPHYELGWALPAVSELEYGRLLVRRIVCLVGLLIKARRPIILG